MDTMALKRLGRAIMMLIMLVAGGSAQATEAPGSLDFAWETQGGSFANGMYVIGDSISLGVPYINVGAQFGMHVWIRGGLGWSTWSHRHQNWGGSNLPSFDDAIRSPASAVFVELGTNDTGCMWYTAPTPPNNFGCFGGAKTQSDHDAELWAIVAEVVSGTQQLLNAGKCVMWAGPREIDREGSPKADAANFNQLLRNLQAMYPGRFFYVDYNAWANSNADLHYALDLAPGADHVHPATDAGRLVIAQLAVWYALVGCHVNG